MTRGRCCCRSTESEHYESGHEHRASTETITSPAGCDYDDRLSHCGGEHDPEQAMDLHIVLTPDFRECH
jgi:hypothetical protein